MVYKARKPFRAFGKDYKIGDTVRGFPEKFFRAEGMIRTGFVREHKTLPAKPKADVEG
jgi:hypothetical protein